MKYSQCRPYTFVHCANHSLDLSLQEVASEITLIRDSFSIVRDIAVIFRESAKRKQKMKDTALDESNQSSEDESVIRQITGDVTVIDNEGAVLLVTTFLALCPTRWCARARALQRVLDLRPSIRRAVNQLHTELSQRD